VAVLGAGPIGLLVLVAARHAGAEVVVVGIAAGPTPVPLHLVQDREISVIGSLMYVREDVEEAIALLATGLVEASDLITATFPLDQAAEAFAASSDPQQVKVLVAVGPPS
jgi:L-iditol 2-dehydrogenase